MKKVWITIKISYEYGIAFQTNSALEAHSDHKKLHLKS